MLLVPWTGDCTRNCLARLRFEPLSPMPRESLFSNLSLAGKITLLVGLMGLVSMAIIGYAMVHMRQMDEQYRTLISLESELAQSFGRMGLVSGVLLGESQRMVHAAQAAGRPSGWGAAAPLAAEAAQRLRTLQREFETELNDIARACRTRAAN